MHPEEIASLLRRAVRERVLRPGQTLNQDVLSRRLGVSRVPVREALRTLVGEGLISMRSGMGAVVSELDADEVEELYDLRLQLEPPLAEAVTRNASECDAEELAGLLRRMDEAKEPDPEEWSGLNYAFRRRMYELSGRPHSVRLATQVLNLVEPYCRYYAHVLGGQERIRNEMAKEITALRERSAERLAEAIKAHLWEARRELAAAMRSNDAPSDDLSELLSDI
ncbi:GntR family transcriptional regulator [Actinomadura rubrobrunea]|uniref:GntR family transcriptional regulator n=1 Tax=Actinomadura rubrobrunea TaxID=115335 RepID=A0A9W6UXC7_9ACTN|nr:GntR family transcriptional regulator [Actinomadura rubrobrunea]GLW67531.1 GntR family transcriptional regulator [Actinomadura rubrobrunea]